MTMDETNETVYVVAPGVTLCVNDDITFHENDEVTPEDFESMAEFRQLLAAKRIIGKEPEPPEPEPESDWDGTSIDEKLDATSPNPVSNRAITKVVKEINRKLIFDTELDENSENAVQNGTIARAVLKKEDSLTEEQMASLLAIL